MKYLLLILIFSAVTAKADPPKQPSVPIVAKSGEEDDDALGQRLIANRDAAVAAQQEAKDAPAGSPQQQDALARANRSAENIAELGEKRPGSYKAQEAVGQTLAQIGEYERAVPFADRGVSLAQANHDQKGESAALVLRGNINLKLKRYPEALLEKL